MGFRARRSAAEETAPPSDGTERAGVRDGGRGGIRVRDRGRGGVRDRGRGGVRDRGRGRSSGRGFGRLRRTLLAVLIAGAVVVPVSAAAAHPEIPAPAPAALAPVTAATLEATYAANRANAAEASRMAGAHGDHARAAADRSMAAPSRDFLTFDGRGRGRAVEVFGDLATADRIAVLVPGSDTTLDTYGRFRAGALALHQRTGPRTAVIAWLGYETPRTISTTALTATRAKEAAPQLRGLISELRDLRELSGNREPRTSPHPAPHISLLCHSYGTVVCARAAGDLDVDDIALLGSPGTGANSAAALHTPARVWASRGADDWVEDVPHTHADLFGTTVGFGTDPVSPSFGAHVFAAGDGGHSDYFRPGSVSLDNLARIVLGDTSEVTRA